MAPRFVEDFGVDACASYIGLVSWLFRTNKKPTNWWGKKNAAPLKFSPKPSEAPFWTICSKFHKCRPAKLMPTYPRGSQLGRHGCRVKFADSRTNRSRDIRAAHFVMGDE